MKYIKILALVLATSSLFAQSKFGFTYTGIYKIIENGDSLKNAWAGGLNAPQFNTIDLNLDNQPDLVVFDRNGNRIIPFLSVTVNGTQRYRYAPEYRKAFPKITNWMLLRDFDCDGKQDIFCFAPSGVGVYKNVSDTALRFQWALPGSYLTSWFGTSNINLYVMSIDIPGIIDIDYDGDLDFFTFSQGSTLEFHKNNQPCGLDFQLESLCWGRFEENQLTSKIILDACPPNVKKTEHVNLPPLVNGSNKVMHAGSTTLMLDLNGDSLNDILIGDVSFTNIVAGFNTGLRDSAVITSLDTLFPSYNTPTDLFIFPATFYEDVTFDGIPDLLAAPNDQIAFKDKNGSWLYKNMGTKMNPTFNLQDTAWLQRDMVDVGSGAYPVLVDLNTDGQPDLVVANYGQLKKDGNYKTYLSYYKNIGNASGPKFELVTTDLSSISGLNIGQNLAPTFGDLDGDIDQDMILGCVDGKLYYFENTGGFNNPNFVISSANFQGIDVGGSSAPHLFDIDDDGDLDLFIGNETGTIHFYENNGTSPLSFTLVSQNFGGVDVRSNTSNQGYSVPYFYRSADTLSLFVGSNDLGIIQYDSISTVIQLPPLIEATVGTGTTSTTDVNTTPFGASKRNGRNQFLYRAADLKAEGFTYGKITNMAFFIPTTPTSIISQGFTVRMKNVNKQSLTGWETGLTEVYNFIFPFSNGWNTIQFSTPFLWDGQSDLLVEVCFSKNFQNVDIPVQCTDVGYAANAYGDVDNWNGVTQNGCDMPFLGTSTLRPNVRFKLVPTFVLTEVVLHDGMRNSFTMAQLTNDAYPDAILGNYGGGITFYKGSKWKANPFDVKEQKLADKNPLNIYPNPASTAIVVELPEEMRTEKTNFELYDLSGRMILAQKATEGQTIIQVSQLSSGVYLLLASDTKQTRHARVVINR
jgi:hypothetical protein